MEPGSNRKKLEQHDRIPKSEGDNDRMNATERIEAKLKEIELNQVRWRQGKTIHPPSEDVPVLVKAVRNLNEYLSILSDANFASPSTALSETADILESK
jgi:hypothetical protein